jgi:hypothetical protein
MLRKTLLVTTALVLCASLSLAGQKEVLPIDSKAMAKAFRHVQVGYAVNGIPVTVTTSKRGTHPVHNVAPHLESAIFSNYSKDANAQFISWYGYTTANESSCGPSSGCYAYRLHFIGEHALAFTPAATVTTKKVTVSLFSFHPSGQFEVDIYSSVGGLPGSVIAHSKKFTDSDTALCCTASRTVAIKANLNAGTQYFLGVVGVCCNAYGGWNMEDTDMSGAAVDYYHTSLTLTTHTTSGRTNSYHQSSPWHASTYYPASGAAILT